MDQYLPPSLSLGIHHVFDTLTQQLYPYAEQTVLVPNLVETTDWKKSHIFLASMLACYPLGIVMHFLPYGTFRHVFSFVTGALLLQTCWGAHWIHTPITSLAAFGLIRLCSSNSNSATLSSTRRLQVQHVVPVFVMGYLAVAHFQHQFFTTNYLGMDIHFTCSQMILTQKLYMLAYNLVSDLVVFIVLLCCYCGSFFFLKILLNLLVIFFSSHSTTDTSWRRAAAPIKMTTTKPAQ